MMTTPQKIMRTLVAFCLCFVTSVALAAKTGSNMRDAGSISVGGSKTVTLVA